ncbi:FhaA domain-containing protein [Streptomyces sp. NPDC092296]|uniref:FhaA domain-containing protein n=1 Tax=Streptomyces sp. NPDC092296 TaxID=3366012 RepID=UPI0037F5B0B8
MGVLKKFEQRLEGLVNGTFAKVFKSEVQPVEIAGALQRECDNNASIWNRDRTVVPNDFIVELSPHDHERLSPYAGQLGQELSGMVREYADAQRYSFMGPLQVHLEKADDLDTGLYRVRSRTLAGSESQQQGPPPGPGPQGYPQQQWGGGSRAELPTGYSPPPAAPPAAPWQQQAPGGYAVPPPPAAPPGVPPHAPGGGNVRAFPGSGSPAGTRHWIEVNGTRHQLTGAATVLGRSTEADIRIDDPGVSRKHAEIRPGSPSMVLDLGSTNGIVVDGQHTQRATLRDGSRIVVGSTTIVYRQAEG